MTPDRPTPETDALYLQHPLYEDAAHQEDLAAWLDHARDLERRLAEAEEKILATLDVYATMRASRDRLREALKTAQLELKHCRVFVSTREKIAPPGLELYDETCRVVDSALAQEDKHD